MNIITGSEVMEFFVYHGFDPETGNRKYPCLSFSQYLGLGQTRFAKFGINIFNKMLLNAAICQFTTFTFSKLLKKNQQGVKIPPQLD